MPVVTVRARHTKRPGEFDALVRKCAEKASDLLEQSDRVLVVYEEGGASLYYEGDGAKPVGAPSPVRAS